MDERIPIKKRRGLLVLHPDGCLFIAAFSSYCSFKGKKERILLKILLHSRKNLFLRRTKKQSLLESGDFCNPVGTLA